MIPPMLKKSDLPTYHVLSGDLVVHLKQVHPTVKWTDGFRVGDMGVCMSHVHSISYPFDNEWLDVYASGAVTVQNCMAIMYALARDGLIDRGLYVITR